MKKGEKKLGAAIKALRSSFDGESLADFGRRIGVRKTSVYRYESGRAEPAPEILARMRNLSLQSVATERLALSFIASPAEQSGVSTASLLLAALISQSHPSSLPTPAELKPILARAKALLGE